MKVEPRLLCSRSASLCCIGQFWSYPTFLCFGTFQLEATSHYTVNQIVILIKRNTMVVRTFIKTINSEISTLWLFFTSAFLRVNFHTATPFSKSQALLCNIIIHLQTLDVLYFQRFHLQLKCDVFSILLAAKRLLTCSSFGNCGDTTKSCTMPNVLMSTILPSNLELELNFLKSVFLVA